MDQDGDIQRDTAAVSTATKGRVRGNGSGSVYYVASRSQRGRPWAAAVVLGWNTQGRPIRRTRYAATEDEAEALLERMVAGDVPERAERLVWEPVKRRPKPQPKERTISKRLRFRVLQRDGFACVYCGRKASPEVTLHLDHRVPFSKGGLTTYDNLVTSCADCNFGKHTLDIEVVA